MASVPSPHDQALNLSPFLDQEVTELERAFLHKSFFQSVRQEGAERNHTRRVENLGILFRDLDTQETAHFLMAAARMSLSGETHGLRVLFSALNVRSSGVDVLRRLHRLSSIERVSMQLLSGKWEDPEASEGENPAFAIIEVLNEASDQGLLVDELGSWPKSVSSVRDTLDILRHWMAWMTLKLAAKQKIPKRAMDLITHICLLEISLAERRVSKLAESIDPYDVRGMSRLMPLLSRYDQAIELWKLVISEIHTYVPFKEVVLTLEAMITDTEMDKVQKTLLGEPGGFVVGLLLQRLREKPILDRELLCLISVLYQTGNLRALMHPKKYPAVDLLSSCVGSIESYQGGSVPPLVLEPEVDECLWPILSTWGVWERTEDGLVYSYNENRSLDFINVDGTPRLDPVPGYHNEKEVSLEDLVLMQMGNDPFILGILDNPKAMMRPTIVTTIATMTRSIRVLSKIAHTRTLHTGQNNKDVPRLLLLNPSRVPVQTLRRFIHVRYVSRTDLEKMARTGSEVRSDVRQEIQRYLKHIKS